MKIRFRFVVLSVVAIFVLSACGWNSIKKQVEKPLHKIMSIDKPKNEQKEQTKPNQMNNQEQSNQNTDNQQQATQDRNLPSKSDGVNQNTQTKDQNSASLDLTLEAKYFNQIQAVNGQPTIVNPDNLLVMVNKTVALPKDFRPSDLIRPNVPFSFGNQKLEKSYLRKPAAIALEKMFAAAKEDGIDLVAASGFRSYQTQAYLFNREIEQVGRAKAEQAVAKPGTSEHQTGLAMDITSASMNYELADSFADMPEGKWLAANAYRFGFVMRYPKGKEAITKYEYEPWHYRYVGVPIATKLYEHDWTLEEYFNKVKKI